MVHTARSKMGGDEIFTDAVKACLVSLPSFHVGVSACHILEQHSDNVIPAGSRVGESVERVEMFIEGRKTNGIKGKLGDAVNGPSWHKPNISVLVVQMEETMNIL